MDGSVTLKQLLRFIIVIRGLEPRIHRTFEGMSENDEQPVVCPEALFCAASDRAGIDPPKPWTGHRGEKLTQLSAGTQLIQF